MTTAGTVTVDDAGARTGSGLALDLYESILAIETGANPLPDPDHKDADFDGTEVEWHATFLPFVVKMKRSWAREAQRHANVIAPIFGVRNITSMVATGSIPLDADTVVCPTRAALMVLTLPASAPIGHRVEVIEVSGSVAFTVTIAAPGGEAVAGLTTLGARLTRTFTKWDATNWVGCQ